MVQPSVSTCHLWTVNSKAWRSEIYPSYILAHGSLVSRRKHHPSSDIPCGWSGHTEIQPSQIPVHGSLTYKSRINPYQLFINGLDIQHTSVSAFTLHVELGIRLCQT